MPPYLFEYFQEPVILMGTDLVSPALHWTLPYLEDNIGGGKHTVYISKSTKFLYFDDKKVGKPFLGCILLGSF